ncbi:uncharacterized protein [Maniola hyperantus]|uniref:uncharacterized protein n=1 Tax=Aphantopus hyperantus TaxID=2795564 RepID=UPI00213E25DE
MVLFAAVSARKLFEGLPSVSNYEGSLDDSPNEMKAQIPVNFRHITREGFGDKQPFDFLHLGMINPRDVKNVKDLLKKDNVTVRWYPPQRKLVFQSPRDEMEYYKNFYNSAMNKKKTNRPFDFSSLLEKNLQDPFANRRGKIFDTQNKRKFPKADKVMPRKLVNISDYFEENRFYRRPDRYHPTINWTTCNEFARNAVFHPEDIVNTKWMPFFIWSRREFRTAVIHTFSYPTKKEVQYFKTTFGSNHKNIDWKQPKLLMNERRRILLIARDRKGFFYGIPDQVLPKNPSFINVTLPTIPLRLKIHDPYLAMMYCDEHYATIMAEMGTEPTSERQALIEASTLNFKGNGMFVLRDIAFEKFRANLKQKRRMEEEARKFIHIRKFTGDVDMQVKHI